MSWSKLTPKEQSDLLQKYIEKIGDEAMQPRPSPFAYTGPMPIVCDFGGGEYYHNAAYSYLGEQTSHGHSTSIGGAVDIGAKTVWVGRNIT